MAAVDLTIRPGAGRAVRAVRTSHATTAIVVIASAIVGWWASATRMHETAISDLGLISATSPLFFAAVLLLIVAACVELTASTPRPLVLAMQTAGLVLMLYGLPIIVETVPRVPTAFVHAGYVDYIRRTGSALPAFDARFSWPGSFAWMAVIHATGNVTAQVQFVRWAPLVLTSLYLLALHAILRGLTTDVRWHWAALLLFALTDWVGQDYYSPQGLNFFLYLCLVAIVLRRLRGDDFSEALARRLSRLRGFALGTAGEEASDLGPDRVAALLAVVLIGGSIVSHQLTPVIIIVALGALAWFGHARTGRVTVAAAALFLAYLSFGAVGYWSGHLGELFGGLGHVGGTAQANVGRRLTGSPGHRFVVDLRIALVLAIGAGALVAFVTRRMGASPRRACAVLALAPFTILFAQSYGGEGLLRSYFFALPFACVLLASLAPRSAEPGGRVPWLPRAAVVGVGVALLPVFLVTRYGNDQFESSTVAELNAVQYAIGHAPPGAPIVALTEHFPWMFRAVEKHRWEDAEPRYVTNPSALRADLAAEAGAWILLTRSQEAYGEAAMGFPHGWITAFGRELEASGRFDVVVENRDATVLVNRTPLPPGPFTPTLSGTGS